MVVNMLTYQVLDKKNNEEKGVIDKEAERLYSKLHHLGWTIEQCKEIAPLTYKINKLKKEKGVYILAHSYLTPEIIFGVSDSVGDSLGLSKKAREVEEQTILFCGVEFMAETAKILNPEKTILVPRKGIGCSLADSITAKDVKKLKEKYPGVPVVCYVNTTAEVKAESDICCTSANAKKIVESLDSDKVIFIPDYNMGSNLAKITGKEIITYNGHCDTHNVATLKNFGDIINRPDVVSLSHLECKAEIVFNSDESGGTGDMQRFVKNAPEDKTILFLTEQGFIDRMKVEHPELHFADSNLICPFMKMNHLEDILEALENPTDKNIIELDEDIIVRAHKAVNNMLKY